MRKIFDFPGGIHPVENKHQSLQSGIRPAGVPPQLIVPLAQHIGAPAEPVVEVGARVLKGQLIAAPEGFVSLAMHAPSSGTVTAIEERPIAHPSGLSGLCIVIDTDGEDHWTALECTPDYRQLGPAALLERIRAAGIAGLGGAGFPASVKLSLKQGVSIETLIINGTECEPYITADDALMRERAERVIAGAEILRYIIAPQETVIGVEDNKPEAIAALRAASGDSGIEVAVFPTKYPSGGERQLIQILTGREVPSGGLPADIGVVCQNVGTAAAVHEAVVHGRPLISRITTVTGAAVARPENFEVLVGTPMSYLLQQAGYRPEQNNRLIMGGPMMGFTVPDPAAPIIKTTNCLLAPTETELPLARPVQACIRCGLCAEACPARLLPQQLYWFAQGKEYEKLEQHHLFDCIECGACSYVCPSNIPLVQYYRASKGEILQKRADHDKAELSRMRFESRQARVEREAAEKEAKRLARRKAAEARARQAAGGEAEDPIQAAIDRARARKAAQLASGDHPASEREALEKAVVSARKRLATAEEKLNQAGTGESELVAALQTGVDKTRARLAQAEQALREHLANAGGPQEEAPVDAAQAAIEKARAARAAAESLSPLEKARQNLQKLEQRLAKSETRLAEGRDAGEEEKILEALESSVQRMRDKVEAARGELASLEES